MRLAVPIPCPRLPRLAAAAALAAAVAALPGATVLETTGISPLPAARTPSPQGAWAPPAPRTLTTTGSPALPTGTTSAPLPGSAAIPPIVADAYRRAASAIAHSDPGCHIGWPVLAGIGQVESGQAQDGQVAPDGTTLHPIVGPALNGQGFAAIKTGNGNWARAVGPMQFIPSTWAKWGADGNGDKRKDPNNIYDAALAAGHYLCAAGGDLATPTGLDLAILAYNHSAPYLADVLSWIHRYQAPGRPAPTPVVQVAAPTTPDPAVQAAAIRDALSATHDRPSAAGQVAIRYAVAQLGKPYLWGGTGPDTFDCSGLTSQAWAHAGVPIPRTSQDQWAQLQHIPLAQIRPGDLIVYFAGATHVALYLGNGNVIQAPHPGAVVDIVPLDSDPVLGAVRPDPGNAASTTPTAPGPSRPTAPAQPRPRPTPPAKPVAPKPPAPAALNAPTVTSAQYPAAPGAGSPAGTAGVFEFGSPSPEAVVFQYSLDQSFNASGATVQTVPLTSSHQGTTTLTPTQSGTHTLYVRYTTKDRRTSPPAIYTFTVAPPAARLTANGDLTGDGLPDRVVLDTVGRLWLYQGQPGGTPTATPHELARPGTTPTATTNWNGVSELRIIASTGPSIPPLLEAIDSGTTYRFALNPDGTLSTQP